MARPINISFAGYHITRVDHPDGQPQGPAKYTVYRPDGTLCCDGKDWPDVERIICEDVKNITPPAKPASD